VQPYAKDTILSSMLIWTTRWPRDAEANLDHAQFRQYSSTLGRWTIPDPADLAAADITNPQSWNRYAYVQNSPLNLIDPLGLFTSVRPGCTVWYPVGGGAGSLDCLSQPWLNDPAAGTVGRSIAATRNESREAACR